MYGLQTAWLGKVQRRRLNGFQARCLRQIHGILPSFLSHVPNKDVLAAAGATLLSDRLLEQQLKLLGNVARSRSGTPLRDAFFAEGTYELQESGASRGRGRPRHMWGDEVYRHAVSAAGDKVALAEKIVDKHTWAMTVKQYIFS